MEEFFLSRYAFLTPFSVASNFRKQKQLVALTYYLLLDTIDLFDMNHRGFFKDFFNWFWLDLFKETCLVMWLRFVLGAVWKVQNQFLAVCPIRNSLSLSLGVRLKGKLCAGPYVLGCE